MGRDHSIECPGCGVFYGGLNGPDEHECEESGGTLFVPRKPGDVVWAGDTIDQLRSELATLKAKNERLRGALTVAREALEQPVVLFDALGHPNPFVARALSRIEQALAPPEATEDSNG